MPSTHHMSPKAFLLVFVYRNKHSGRCGGSGFMLSCTRHTSSTPHTSPIHQMSPSRHRSSAISFFEFKHQHLAPLFLILSHKYTMPPHACVTCPPLIKIRRFIRCNPLATCLPRRPFSSSCTLFCFKPQKQLAPGVPRLPKTPRSDTSTFTCKIPISRMGFLIGARTIQYMLKLCPIRFWAPAQKGNILARFLGEP